MKGKQFGVFGVGKYGSSIARKLVEKGAEVYAFDSTEEKIEAIKDDVAFAVTLDATDKRALRSQNVQDLDTAIVSIGENFQAVILCAVNLMELQVPRIIARASGPQQRLILEKIGIQEILTPEDEVASAVAENLMNPSIVNFLQLPDDHEIAEVKAPKAIIDRTVGSVGLVEKYSLTLVTIKREYEVAKGGETCIEQHIIGVASAETVIEEKDTLVVFGKMGDIERFLELNQ